MKNKNNLLIVEMSSSALSVAASENGSEKKEYVLEGIFGQIDQKNRNNRIYTEAEYLPQIEALQAKIKSSKLLGELDHPAHFDISLKNVSHVIEDLHYDKDSKQVRGRIRLLDTDAGRQAKALVDAGVPLQISSRAAGAVESNGQVKIKQLFTYDLVADPGFENAELKRVNEALGYDDNQGLFIYEMSPSVENQTENVQPINTTEIKESKNMAEFVQAEDFNKYSEYLAKEIKAIKEQISASQGNDEVAETIKNVVSHNDHIVENVNNLTSYVEYVAGKLDDSIQYSEHVAEKADQSIQYAEHLAEKLDQGISYSEHLAEAVAKVKDFANYLAEAHNEGSESYESIVSYVNYLKENLQSVSEYAEYIAESINENVVVEEVVGGEEAGKEHEEAEKSDELENVGDNAKEGDVDAAAEEVGVDATKAKEADLEVVGDNAKEGDVDASAEEVAKDAANEPAGTTEVSNSEKDNKTVDANGDALEDEGEEGALDVVEEEDALEAYKKSISAKLDALVESATVAENTNPSFFRIVSATTREKYNNLSESVKTDVRATVAKRGFMTESEIVSLMESTQLILENAGAQPFVIEAMPTEYSEAWTNLSESKKTQILAQAKYHTLSTEYQVANFWQTRDLRESASTMEKIAMVTESTAEPVSTTAYDVSGYAEAFKKRFSK
jgi:hypothetical protein